MVVPEVPRPLLGLTASSRRRRVIDWQGQRDMSNISVPYTGLGRRMRRLLWSTRRRLTPDQRVTLPFDNGLKLQVRRKDRLARRVYLEGYSDRELAYLVDLVLKPGMVFFDVGAHFGQFTLMASPRVGARGQVHGFEPTTETFGQLKANIELNALENVTINHNAVYHEKTTLELKVCDSGRGEFNTLGQPARRGGGVDHIEKIEAIRLDDYVVEHQIGRVDLMKIDVEGAEDFVLRGGADLLSREDAPILSIEFSERNVEAMGYGVDVIRTRMQGFGYTLFSFTPESGILSPFPDDAQHADGDNVIGVKSRDNWPGTFA